MTSFCIANHSTLSFTPIYTLGNTRRALLTSVQRGQELIAGMDHPLTYLVPGNNIRSTANILLTDHNYWPSLLATIELLIGLEDQWKSRAASDERGNISNLLGLGSCHGNITILPIMMSQPFLKCTYVVSYYLQN